MQKRKLFRMTQVIFFFITWNIISCCSQNSWPLGWYDNRSWERIEVDGATSGGGTPYAFFFSPASRPEGKYRLAIYFPGGGSTEIKSDGSFSTAINSIGEIRTLMNVGESPGEMDRLFMDHPDNDAFIGCGNWVIIPYTTQDRHIGRRSNAEVYDLTNSSNNKIKKQAEIELNKGISIDSLEQQYPGLKIIEVEGTPGHYQIKKLELHIVHRGALNIDAVNQIVFARIRQISPDFFTNAKILISGGSAGAYGAWYNFYKYGDLFYEYPNAQITLAPMGGSPITQMWDNNTEDLEFLKVRADDIKYRFPYYNAVQPCDVAGGTYAPGPNDDCLDVLNLLDHYLLQRYPNKDIRYIPLINKEDNVIVSSMVNKPNFEENLLNFIKTAHRYSQYMSQKENTFPIALWLFLNEYCNYDEYNECTCRSEHPSLHVF